RTWCDPWSTAPSTVAVAALTSNFAVEQTAARIRSLAAAHRGVGWPSFTVPASDAAARGRGDGMIPRRIFLATATAALLAAPGGARAQRVEKVPRIGMFRLGPFPPSWIESFWQGLRELGYVEGRSIIVEYGLAPSVAQLPEVAAKLIRLRVDVLVASGTASVLPARNATSTIPVVFVAAIDPVAAGVVASLARPGGNVTGVSAAQTDLTGKRFGLLKELLPKLSRVAFLVRDPSPATAGYVKEAELAARTLGTQLQILTVRDPSDFERALSAAQGASALLHVDDAMFTAHRVQIAALALKNRLPAMSGLRETVEAGGFMAYGPNLADLYRRAATLVHKILKGAKPADLPVEEPTKFELVINLKTAKALGLVVPQSLLVRADKVIE
ncbi:MAG: ABC transporter substrate-binding protein, partial [bacterium]